MLMNSRVIWAVFKRNFASYFINPTGYVFITVFILLGAIAAFWDGGFFLSNLANLDRLNAHFPLLLLFFVPALTMNVWAEERRQGTDELLFTLPGHDVDIVLGKYLAALGIYTVALFFSLSHLVILVWLGNPDMGLMFACYLGYWLAGAALLSVGMAASLLTANATVAFILGAIFCGALVFLNQAEMIFGAGLSGAVDAAALVPHFNAFGSGSIPIPSLFYFVAVTVVMLYVNVALVGRRHHAGGEGASLRAAHFGVRILSLALIVTAVTVIAGRLRLPPIDATAERLHTLQPQTAALIAKIPDDRPVFVQAFFSQEVPESHVQTRKDLVNLLHKFDQVGGNRIRVAIHATEPFTELAALAADNYNIVPRKLLSVGAGQRSAVDVFLGLVFTSGPEEFVIPFFDRGLPVEYELARSIRVVSQTARRTLGIVNTDAKLFGGFDFESMNSSPDWSIVQELRKQYEVQQVPPDGPYPDGLDVLLVVLPSSLTQPQLDALQDVILAGTPTLLLDDPMPMYNIQLSPRLPKDAGRNPFASRGQPPSAPKGDFKQLLSTLGLKWQDASVVWSRNNPHPIIADVPPEIVFVTPSPDNGRPFNPDSPISSGLQEVVLLYPGYVSAAPEAGDARLTALPLLQTGTASGDSAWNDLVSQSFFGVRLNPSVRRVQSPNLYYLAMQVHGERSAEAPGQDAPEAGDSAATPPAARRPINVIMIGDTDIISETFFDLRRQGLDQFNFDNVTFALNCIDALAGDESFIELRKHRPRHRTLARLEHLTEDYTDHRRQADDAAEAEAAQKLSEAQAAVDRKVGEVRERTDLDERTKSIMLANLEKVENRRFEVVKSNIESEKDRRLARAAADMQIGIARIQREIKWWAAILPPIPTLVLAIVLFAYRYKREQIGVPEGRLVGSKS